MKKGIFLLIAIMFLSTVSANNIYKSANKIEVINRYNNVNNVITFIERNIEFHVFLNGDFDFNTDYKNTKHRNYNNGVRIKRNHRGRIKSINRTFINYGINGNVTRIGSVFIDYRFGKLIRVGNLKVSYDNWDTPQFYGNVKHNNYCGTDYYHNINATLNYDNPYFYRRNFRTNYHKYKEDRNYLYYKATPNSKTKKRSQILKRRKNNPYSKKPHHKKTTTHSRRSYKKDN